MDTSIKERIKLIANQHGYSIRKFEEHCQLGRGNISNMSEDGSIGSDKLSKIIDNFPEISIHWLLTGKGDMQQKNNVLSQIRPASSLNEGIPLIPISAMAGFGQGDMQVLEYECERFVIPTFHEAEFLIQVKGSSMYPKYSSGDIVACKKLPIDTFFQWNKVYVLDTVQGALIKRIKKASSEDNLLIVSDNPKYEPFELKRSEIRSIAIVIGVIRLE